MVESISSIVEQKNTRYHRVFFVGLRRVFFLGLSFLFWSDVYECSRNDFSSEVFDFFSLKFNKSIDESKESVILTLFDVFSRMKLSTSLANNDVADRDCLIAEDFHTKTFGDRITAKSG